jgi:hypothetical protein
MTNRFNLNLDLETGLLNEIFVVFLSSSKQMPG